MRRALIPCLITAVMALDDGVEVSFAERHRAGVRWVGGVRQMGTRAYSTASSGVAAGLFAAVGKRGEP